MLDIMKSCRLYRSLNCLTLLSSVITYLDMKHIIVTCAILKKQNLFVVVTKTSLLYLQR